MAEAIGEKYYMVEVNHQMRESFQNLNRMREKGVLCDVTLVVKNVEILAHKNVLASCSPYFYAMFVNEETAKRQRIELDVNPDILLLLVNFMYTSKLTIPANNITDVLEISKMLLLNSVQNECCNILQHFMCPNTCLGIKTLAIKYANSEVLKSIVSYIDSYFNDVASSEEFLKLTNDEISQLISRHTLRVRSEENVYEYIVRWVKHNPEEREKYIRSLMGYVRLPFISKSYKEEMMNDPFLKGDAYCKDLINKALHEDSDSKDLSVKPRRYFKHAKILLAIGGSGKKDRKSLEYYDLENKKWSKILKIPFDVYGAGLAVVDRKVYVTGGMRDDTCINTVCNYDVAQNSWHEIGNMTTVRSAHGVAVLNDCIYAIGGRNGWRILNCGEKFDLNTQKWTSIAPMYSRRENFGIAVLNNIIYAIGGYDSSWTLKYVECYDHQTDSWREVAPMNKCRSGVGVCTLDGQLYAIGGYNGTRALRVVEVYNSDTNTWTILTPMKTPRAWAGVAVVNNKIYVVGGRDQIAIKSVEVYDKVTNSWTMLPNYMNIAREAHGLVVVDKPI